MAKTWDEDAKKLEGFRKKQLAEHDKLFPPVTKLKTGKEK